MKVLQDGMGTFYFPGVGNYVYGANDIYYYGMRRTMADVTGVKLTKDQFVRTKDGRQGIVQEVTDTNARIVFGGWGGQDGLYDQRDIDRAGIMVLTAARRQCTNTGCM